MEKKERKFSQLGKKKRKRTHYLARRTQSTFFIFPNIRASDGCLKEDQDYLYIHTNFIVKAVQYFTSKTGHNPNRV